MAIYLLCEAKNRAVGAIVLEFQADKAWSKNSS